MRKPQSVAFLRRYGPAALIAGASEGIGAAFARKLAGLGFDLVLVARRAEPLETLAAELRAENRVEVRIAPCDLADPGVAETIAGACRGLEVGLLVYNAAASTVGRFLDIPIEDHLRAIEVNARGPVVLAHAFAGEMARRGSGGIVLMSSLTAFQGTPLVTSYGATKAFDLVLAEGLWGELRERGIDVLACCAGATLTPGYERVTGPASASGIAPRPQQPAEVVGEALDALGRRPFVVTGRANRIASFVMRRILTRRAAVAAIGRQMRQRYG
jgi:short-subunit dehydrogenase